MTEAAEQETPAVTETVLLGPGVRDDDGTLRPPPGPQSIVGPG